MRCTWLIVLVVLLAVSVVVAQMGQEVPPVFTEDFETPDETGTLPKDWKHFSKVHTISLSTEQAHGGKYSLKLVDEDPVNAVGLRSPHIKVTPGKYVWVSWWYYGEQGNNQSMYIEFWTADGKRPQDASRSWGSAGKGKWIHQTKRAKVPADTATITLHANSYSTNVATGYFDDIEFGIGAKSMYDRTPQPAADVKHPCGLYKEADIERARRNIEKHAWAQATLASFKSASKFWMDCPDEQLSYLLTAPSAMPAGALRGPATISRLSAATAASPGPIPTIPKTKSRHSRTQSVTSRRSPITRAQPCLSAQRPAALPPHR